MTRPESLRQKHDNTPGHEKAPLDLDVTIEDPGWQTVLGPHPEEWLRPLVDHALRTGLHKRDASGHHDSGHGHILGIRFADDLSVRHLNSAYRGKDKPTNVLSFAQQDGEAMPLPDGAPVEWGDLVLARETVLREAALQDRPIDHHVSHLIVHGVLHLLGFDHMNDNDAEIMESLEIDILHHFSIPNPYQEETPTVDSTGGTS